MNTLKKLTNNFISTQVLYSLCFSYGYF